MKFSKKIIMLVYALGLIIPSTLLQAGDHSHHGLYQQSNNSGGGGNSSMTDSQSSLFLTLLVSAAILIAPIAYSVEAVGDSVKGSGQSSAESKTKPCDRPCCGQQLPEMEVKQIGYNNQGQRQVLFAVADNPQQHLTLIWLLAHQKHNLPDPASNFVVGQKVNFQPSVQFSGCLLQDTLGTPLAFVPAGNSVRINYSETF